MRAVACPNNGHKAWPAQARMGDNASAVVTTNVDNKKVFMTWHTYLQHVKQFWNPVDPRLVHLIAPTLVNWLTRHEPRVVFLPPPPDVFPDSRSGFSASRIVGMELVSSAHACVLHSITYHAR